MITMLVSRIVPRFVNGNYFRQISTSLPKRDHVQVTIENGVQTILMNRPEKYNALYDKMYREMAASLLNSNTDDRVKIVVITGAGDKFFTSGWDIHSLVEDCRNRVNPFENGPAALMNAFIECKKPLVALVNGSAMGIGVTMLAHCEAVYSTDKAMFNTPFIKLGLPPEACSSYLFPKIMGHAKAGQLLHFNETWTAKYAHECGLITKVFSQEQFTEKCEDLVKKMAEYPLRSLLRSKALLRDRERETLRKVFREEFSLFDTDLVGEKAEMMLETMKKKK